MLKRTTNTYSTYIQIHIDVNENPQLYILCFFFLFFLLNPTYLMTILLLFNIDFTYLYKFNNILQLVEKHFWKIRDQVSMNKFSFTPIS
jgi:hypothetical protein